jgi:Domain of Unknown Function (DUF349)
MEDNKNNQNPELLIETKEENPTTEKKVIEEKQEENKLEVSDKKEEKNPILEKKTKAKKEIETENSVDDNNLDEDESEEIEEEVIDYTQYSVEELVKEAFELAEQEYTLQLKTKMGEIKLLLEKQFSQEKRTHFEEYVKEGKETKEYKEEVSEFEKTYRKSYGKYKTKQKKYLEELDKLKQKNLEEKHRIFEELKKLIDSKESLKETYDKFKELQQQWRDVGLVPRGEIQNLWNQYNYLVEKFLERVKIVRELKDLDLKKNLEQKIVLCEKVEELLLESSIVKSFKALQNYHKQYKEIGAVPADKKDEIWERFKAATDKINERRREFYSKREEDEKKNYDAKIALCEKVEELFAKTPTTNQEWADSSKEMTELLKIWKTYGPAPKEHNEDVWERFKSVLDAFFDNKKRFFDVFKDKLKENLNIKVNLCIQAEAMQESTNWSKTTKDLIQLQKEWKKIGSVPRIQSDKVWKRFRVACDAFFNAKDEYFGNIEEHEEDHFKQKKKLLTKINKFAFSEDKKEALQQIKDFQREWTEVGRVPLDKQKEIQNDYRKIVDEVMKKIGVSTYERKTINYKSKYENLLSSDDSYLVKKEITKLNNRVGGLENDINVWENNIGFLSGSKNADAFKQDFEKRIEKARKELDLLKEELKFLKQQDK